VVRGDVEVPIYHQPKQSRAKVFLVFYGIRDNKQYIIVTKITKFEDFSIPSKIMEGVVFIGSSFPAFESPERAASLNRVN